MSKTPLQCFCGDPECPSCGTAQGTYQEENVQEESTLEVLRRLRGEMQKNEKGVACANTGWYNGSRSAHHKDAELITAEIKRLEGVEEKP